MAKVTWNDIHESKPKELMKKYKLNERQLQQELTGHLYGADHSDRKKMYEKMYDPKKNR